MTRDGDYVLCTHAEAGPITSELARLERVAFEGVHSEDDADDGFMQWYRRRPGMDPALCQAALHEGELVSSVFVTLCSIWLGGELTPVGLIDTVMTHPEHRRRGLATGLLERAHDALAARGAEAVLLYTEGHGRPRRLYESLGYEVCAEVELLLGPRAERESSVQLDPVADGEAIRKLLDSTYKECDGYAPLTEDLWRWRRILRPDRTPCRIYGVLDGNELVACVSMVSTSVWANGVHDADVASDVAWKAGSDVGREHLASLMACAAQPQVAAHAPVDSGLSLTLRDLGFRVALLEVAMCRPMSDDTRQWLRGPTKEWYPTVESIVGP